MNNLHTDDISINNIQTNEEEEDLEEQRRRQEELGDLLSAGIRPFNYGDSTANSSTNVSLISCTGNVDAENTEDTANKTLQLPLKYDENIMKAHDEEIYRNTPINDQLKVLYEIRVREIDSLRDELKSLQNEKANEINLLKNKMYLNEAEKRQFQLSLSNAENLLVEKTSKIRDLEKQLSTKNNEIKLLDERLEQNEADLCAYKTSINQLQMQLIDANPYKQMGNNFVTEEIHRAHQEQILKLENLLQEQTKKAEIALKDYSNLEETLKKSNDIQNDYCKAIENLTKTLENCQRQCEDLVEINKCLKDENGHLQKRLDETKDSFTIGNDILEKDKETLKSYLEKFKKLFLDKSLEANTLKATLKDYEQNLKELLEYRKIISRIWSASFESCNDKTHQEKFILLQNNLDNCKQTLNDRSNEIIRLSEINKELQEKIEEMLQQTRNDIQTLSQKYNVPQLEIMSNDLKKAQETINELQNVCKKYEEESKKYEEKLTQSEKLIQNHDKEKQTWEEILSKVKQSQLELNEENMKLKSNINSKVEKLVVGLKKRFTELIENLNNTTLDRNELIKKLKKWNGMLEDISNKSFESVSDEIRDDLERIAKENEELNGKIAELNLLKTQQKLIQEENSNLRKHLADSQQKIDNILDENRKLKEEISKMRDIPTSDKDNTLSGNMFEEKLIQAEIRIRHQLEEEYAKRLQILEEKCQPIPGSNQIASTDMEGKIKMLENNFRKQLAFVLGECAKKMSVVEEENEQLKKTIQEILHEYDNFKKDSNAKYVELNKKYKTEIDSFDEKWKNFMQHYMVNYICIQKKAHNKLGKVATEMDNYDSKIKSIEKEYDKKLRRLQTKHRTTK